MRVFFGLFILLLIGPIAESSDVPKTDSLTECSTGLANVQSIQQGALKFDESINFAPPFPAWQLDPRLNDLFVRDGNGETQCELCWPTVMASAMAYFKYWSTPPISMLPLVADPRTADFTNQIREFAKLSGTDPNTGTHPDQEAAAVRSYLESAGIANPWVHVIGPYAETYDPPPDEGTNEYIRAPELKDVRDGIQAHEGVVMDIGGHVLWVVGYDYNVAWGDDHILLKIVNPLIDYSGRPIDSRWDPFTMTKIQPGQFSPPVTKYAIQGAPFGRYKGLSFARNLIIFKVK